MARIQFLHDHTLVRKPGLSDAEVREIEQRCDQRSISPQERSRLIYCVANRGDELDVDPKFVEFFARQGLAIPANDESAALVSPSVLANVRKAEMAYRQALGAQATGDSKYDLKSPRIPLDGRRARAANLELLRDIQAAQAAIATEQAADSTGNSTTDSNEQPVVAAASELTPATSQPADTAESTGNADQSAAPRQRRSRD